MNMNRKWILNFKSILPCMSEDLKVPSNLTKFQRIRNCIKHTHINSRFTKMIQKSQAIHEKIECCKCTDKYSEVFEDMAGACGVVYIFYNVINK